MALDFGKLNFSTSFNPTAAFPIDARSYFESLTAAQTAVASAEEAGDSTTVYYFGEQIVVYDKDNNTVTVYVIEKVTDASTKGYHGGLKEVGSKTLGDGASIDLVDGVLSIHNFSEALASQVAYRDANGKIAWATVDTLVTVDGKSIVKGTNGLEVKVDSTGGLNVDQTNGLEIKVKANGGLATDANGAYVDTTVIATNTSVTQAVGAETTRATGVEGGLDTRIRNLEARGRYLSTWDAATGLPGDYPTIPTTETGLTYTYTFKAGDYYIINNIPATGTVYKPKDTSTSITATRTSTTAEWVWTAPEIEAYTGSTAAVVGGQFVYSTTGWNYVATAKDTAWGTITGNISDQTDLQTALNAKATDSAVVHKTGNETINGVKTFNNDVHLSDSDLVVEDGGVIRGGSNLVLTPGTNSNIILEGETYKGSVAEGNQVVKKSDLSAKQDVLSEGSGIDITDNAVSVDSTVVRTTGAQTIAGKKTFTDEVTVQNDYGSVKLDVNTDGDAQIIASAGKVILEPAGTAGAFVGSDNPNNEIATHGWAQEKLTATNGVQIVGSTTPTISVKLNDGEGTRGSGLTASADGLRIKDGYTGDYLCINGGNAALSD